MRHWKTLTVLSSILLMATMGCNDAGKDGGGATGASEKPAGDAGAETSSGTAVAGQKIELCAKCGHFKGTADCCKEGAEPCAGCQLAKGSAGCCKFHKGETPPEVCAKCGHLKGTEDCCKQGAEKCPKCNLAKGSLACCKLMAAAAGSAEEGS